MLLFIGSKREQAAQEFAWQLATQRRGTRAVATLRSLAVGQTELPHVLHHYIEQLGVCCVPHLYARSVIWGGGMRELGLWTRKQHAS